MDFDICMKLIIVGDSGVGKTNILNRFTKNIFNEDNKSTIGVEFGTKLLEIQNHTVKLQIWDTAGQERYKAITVAYYKGSKGALIVFDLTRKETFKNVLRWYTDIKQNGEKDTCIILVGNKSDLEEREVSFEEAMSFAEKYSINFIFLLEFISQF